MFFLFGLVCALLFCLFSISDLHMTKRAEKHTISLTIKGAKIDEGLIVVELTPKYLREAFMLLHDREDLMMTISIGSIEKKEVQLPMASAAAAAAAVASLHAAAATVAMF